MSYYNEQELIEIDRLCKEYCISDYSIDDEGFINVEGNVTCAFHKLSKIPLKFGIVNGTFLAHCNNLITLENSPRIVTGSFYCDYNKLKSLVGGPEEVGKVFFCHNNELESLEGAPKVIGGAYGRNALYQRSYWACRNNPLLTEEMMIEYYDSVIGYVFPPWKMIKMVMYSSPWKEDDTEYYPKVPFSYRLNHYKKELE